MLNTDSVRAFACSEHNNSNMALITSFSFILQVGIQIKLRNNMVKTHDV